MNILIESGSGRRTAFQTGETNQNTAADGRSDNAETTSQPHADGP
jgi:hypothetical protein